MRRGRSRSGNSHFRRIVEEQLDLTASFDGAVFCIELFGELDLATAPVLEKAIARAEETDATTVLVDLSALAVHAAAASPNACSAHEADPARRPERI